VPRKDFTNLAPVKLQTPTAYVEGRLQNMIRLYERARFKLQGRLAEGDLTPFAAWRANEIIKQLNWTINDLNRRVRQLTPKIVREAYKRGSQVAIQVGKDIGVTGEINYGNRLNTQTVAVLTDQMTRDLVTANASMKKTIPSFLRATQQKILEDRAITELIAEGIVLGEARKATSDALYQTMRIKMAEGQFITINGRNYNPESYAELVVRTRTREAAAQGTVNSALELGMDLVQIDVHGDACPLCRTRMGRVYSISGTHPEFPPLDARPPYHPNCECNLFPVTEGYLRRRGIYDQMRELSQKTPKFSSPQEAQQWLNDHKNMDIKTLKDLREGGWLLTGQVVPRGVSAPFKQFTGKIPSSPVDTVNYTIDPKVMGWYGSDLPAAKRWTDKYNAGKKVGAFPIKVSEKRKELLVQRIAQKTQIPEETVNLLIHSWAVTSNDRNPTSLFIQQRVEKVFGAPLSAWQQRRIMETAGAKSPPIFRDIKTGKFNKRYLGPYTTPEELVDKFLITMYEETQRSFREAGIKTVSAFRGIMLDKAKHAKIAAGGLQKIKGNAIESWSFAPGIANSFAARSPFSMVIGAEIPVERILATPLTGFGCSEEFELVVLGREEPDVCHILWK